MQSSVTRALTRCSCNVREVNGILSHTISTEQTCHFFLLTTSAISPSVLKISPTPFFLDDEPVMFQKTSSAFLLFWKDTIAAALCRQNLNQVPGRNEKIMIPFFIKVIIIIIIIKRKRKKKLRGGSEREGGRGERRGAESRLLPWAGEARAPMKSSRLLGGKKLFLLPVGSELSNYLVYLLLLEVNDWRDLGCVIDTTLSIDRNK